MNLLFLGDSLIEYFDWQERFPGHRVANLGIAGESVEGLLSRVMKVKDGFPEADMIFIMSGINNVAMGDIEFFDFYKVILEQLTSFYPKAKIYIHSLLPTSVAFIANDSIRLVNKFMQEIARNAGAEYLDVYSIFVDTQGTTMNEYLMDDGVHVSRAGYDVWAKIVEEKINSCKV